MKQTIPKTLAALALFFVVTTAAVAADKPNVVIRLADNMGYGDLGSYGSGGELRGVLDTLYGLHLAMINVEQCSGERPLRKTVKENLI